MTGFVGRWELSAVGHGNVPRDEALLDGKCAAAVSGLLLPQAEFNRRWLAGDTFGHASPVAPLTGLVLTVAPDLAFTEAGDAHVDWFTDEGVLEPEAEPFDGRILTTSAGSFLLLHEAVAWAAPYNETDEVRLRLNDGDTAITDMVALQGDRLRRTVSVVTDGLYEERLLYDYTRCRTTHGW